MLIFFTVMEGGTSERETQSSPQTTTAGRVLGSMAPAVATAVGTPQYHQLDSPILTVQKELKAMKEKASKDYTHILQNQSIIKDLLNQIIEKNTYNTSSPPIPRTYTLQDMLKVNREVLFKYKSLDSILEQMKLPKETIEDLHEFEQYLVENNDIADLLMDTAKRITHEVPANPEIGPRKCFKHLLTKISPIEVWDNFRLTDRSKKHWENKGQENKLILADTLKQISRILEDAMKYSCKRNNNVKGRQELRGSMSGVLRCLTKEIERKNTP